MSKLNEAGRKVSKANERKLRAALKEITDILALLDGGDESAEMQEARAALREAANLGNWLESRLHLHFTMIADDLFGDGRLTRDERVALSGAIGDALDAFNAAVAKSLPQIYQRGRWADPDALDAMTEAGEGGAPAELEGDVVPLVERALRRDGTVRLRIIKSGWGASGYYPAAVLERDGPLVFKKGMQQFWDHQTAVEEAERPEGSLRNLAAELISDARYEANGPDGPGLYADAKVFAPYQEAVNELAPHIGVSIRASGPVQWGSAEGREGRIVQGITSAKSVDFVTKPGAGGKIIEMFEAARSARQPEHQSSAPAGAEEHEVNEQQFQEAVNGLNEKVQAVTQQNQTLTQENARLREAMLLRDARDQVQTALAAQNIPDVTKRRLVESLAANPPVTEANELDRAALTTRISEAVKAEVSYLTEAAGYGSGRIEGMGSGALGDPAGGANAPTAEEQEKALVESFRALGMSEKEAAIAAQGRGR